MLKVLLLHPNLGLGSGPDVTEVLGAGGCGGAGGRRVRLHDRVAALAAQPDAHQVAAIPQVPVQLLHLYTSEP